jgi:hypothetical protein
VDFENMSPEELQQLMHLGSLSEQQDIIKDQIAQAMALRKPSGVQHTTGLGALFGSLGDTLGNGLSVHRENQLRHQQHDLMGQQERARGLFADAMFPHFQPNAFPPSSPPMVDAEPQGPEMNPPSEGVPSALAQGGSPMPDYFSQMQPSQTPDWMAGAFGAPSPAQKQPGLLGMLSPEEMQALMSFAGPGGK